MGAFEYICKWHLCDRRCSLARILTHWLRLTLLLSYALLLPIAAYARSNANYGFGLVQCIDDVDGCRWMPYGRVRRAREPHQACCSARQRGARESGHLSDAFLAKLARSGPAVRERWCASQETGPALLGARARVRPRRWPVRTSELASESDRGEGDALQVRGQNSFVLIFVVNGECQWPAAHNQRCLPASMATRQTRCVCV